MLRIIAVRDRARPILRIASARRNAPLIDDATIHALSNVSILIRQSALDSFVTNAENAGPPPLIFTVALI
jgi:hypothetical protein